MIARRLLEALGLGLLFALAFDLAAVPALAFLEPLVGLLFLSLVFRSAFRGRHSLWGFLAFLIGFWGIFHWVPQTLAIKGPMPIPMAILGTMLLNAWEALGFWGVLLLARWLGQRSGAWGAGLGAALGIALWELLGFHVYPFTWGTLVGGLPILVRSAAFLGSHGLSALLWGAGAMAGLLWAERKPRPFLPPLALLAGLLLLGLAWPLLPKGPEHHLDVVMIQPNWPAGQPFRGMEARLWERSDRELQRAGLPRSGRTTLLLWPESSVMGRNDLAPNPRLPEEARRRGIAWLYGTEGERFNLVRGEAPGSPSFLQAKVVPMPFGERMPGPEALQRWLDERMGFLSQEPGTLGPQSSFALPGLKVHPLICSEALIPWRVLQGLDQAGGDVLANLTNDGWFERSIATDLHGAQIRLRAVETGLPLLRATLTGKSGVFRADGSGGLWGEPMSEAAHAFPLDWRPVKTPARSPLVLVGELLLLALATLLVGWLVRRS